MISNFELLQKMMACKPLSSAPAAVNNVTDILRDYLNAAGLFTEIKSFEDRNILYAATVADRNVDVLLNAHLDVVPAEHDDAFILKKQDGWYFGRGTCDCLGNAVVTVNALILANGKASAGAFFSTDEETGGQTTVAMLQHGYRARKAILVMDASDYYTVATAQKGVLNLRLQATGKACHSAEPWKGENAIDKLIDGYLKIRQLFKPVLPPDEWHNTLAATIINAGSVSNRVPDLAEMTLNIRYTERTDATRLLKDIENVSNLNISCDMSCPPVHCNPDAPVIQHLLDHFERGLGRALTVKKLNGATDARHFVDMNLPIALLGIPGYDPHGAAERIEVKGFELFPQVLATFLEQL